VSVNVSGPMSASAHVPHHGESRYCALNGFESGHHGNDHVSGNARPVSVLVGFKSAGESTDMMMTPHREHAE
jgi:hypothetical protein